MPETIQQLACGRQTYQYSSGCVLFYQDHMPLGLWLLLEGALVFEYNGVVRGYASAPAVIGLTPYLQGTPYAYTARAAHHAVVAHIGKSEKIQTESVLQSAATTR